MSGFCENLCTLLIKVPEQDDEEAISESNILDERTRGAKPDAGSYEEPSDTVPELEN